MKRQLFKVLFNPFQMVEFGWMFPYSDFPGDPFMGKAHTFPGGLFDSVEAP